MEIYFLTCWSHSGQDLVAILTFFVLFVDIVRFLGRHTDSCKVASVFNFNPKFMDGKLFARTLTHGCKKHTPMQINDNTPLQSTHTHYSILKAKSVSMRTESHSACVLLSSTLGKMIVSSRWQKCQKILWIHPNWNLRSPGRDMEGGKNRRLKKRKT